MKRTITLVMCIFLLWGCTYLTGEKTEKESFSKNLTPPNEIGIAKLLKKKGILDENASRETIDREINNYLKTRLAQPQKNSLTNDKKVLAEKLQKTGIQKKHGLNFRNMFSKTMHGKKPFGIDGVKEQPYTGSITTIKLLILLADFTDDTYDTGPQYNQIAVPENENNTTFWVNNFDTEHYNKMLFTKGGYDAVNQYGETLHLDSMVDYYLAQSGGSFSVEGNAYGWFTMAHSEAYYGDNEPDSGRGGVDNLEPGTSHDLVIDVLKAAQEAGVPFENYDVEDPYDLNGNGNYYEPDGIIDHLVIIHAGLDESEGGGAQGDNALWAHSSSVLEYIPSNNPTVDYWNGNMVASNYIMGSENGTIGLFCHELAHDIGLPDEYDTIYSGLGEPVGFFSLMAKGSWSGKPLGTKPASMSPWGRMTLGQIWGGQWVKPLEIASDDITIKKQYYKLDQSCDVGLNNQVLKVNLPLKQHALVAPYEGEWEWYSGKGDEEDFQLVTQLVLPDNAQNIALDFQTWYNIEEEWDYAFVQVSTDAGETWTSLNSPRMTSNISSSGMDSIRANLPGYTGSSDGWVNEVIDLTPFSGQVILLSFRYMTDWGTTLDGMFIDNIKVLADGIAIFSDTMENGNAAWTATGWALCPGYEMKKHYYMVEWRTDNKVDAAMDNCYYLYDTELGRAKYYKQEQGMVVWYRDTSFTDNWIGVHPGHVFLGVVDARPKPIQTRDGYFKSVIQIHDAAFNLERVKPIYFNIDGTILRLPGDRALPTFTDTKKFWYEEMPDSGLILPQLGLKFQVTGRSRDKTVAQIAISKEKRK